MPVGMNAANNMNFGSTFSSVFLNIGKNIVNAAFPRPFLSLVSAIGAKLTMVDTDICGLDMKIPVEKNIIATQSFFYNICKNSQKRQFVTLVKQQCIVGCYIFTIENFACYRFYLGRNVK